MEVGDVDKLITIEPIEDPVPSRERQPAPKEAPVEVPDEELVPA